MGKNKLNRFAENETFSNLVQPQFSQVFEAEHPLKGCWRREVFRNDNPVILEIGCGRGEYTIGLARKFPEINFIGIDIKGARIWRGAKTAVEENLHNSAFLRTRVEFIGSLFAEGEVDEIWITFPDPQLRKNRVKKRLTSPQYLSLYRRILKPEGVVNLKTDSLHLHRYTMEVARQNGLPVVASCEDIYGTGYADDLLSIRTTYESRFLAEGKAITFMKFRLDGKEILTAPVFPPDEDESLSLDR